ncbi:MAG: sulfate adenylyltransferase [Campylobacterota bacterium]|nr:sulfate adenylyltransferase [Campylobacterota bacterium]
MFLKYELNEELYQDCINIAIGLFNPLKGFMTSADYHSVVENMRLTNQEIWTIPITLDIDKKTYLKALELDEIELFFKKNKIGYLNIEDCYIVNQNTDIKHIFGTNDINHPGVKKELLRHKYRVGGNIKITDKTIFEGNLNPKVTKNYFQEKGWKTIAGFQTRNPVHKAHEHLHRVALDICDGLFINPLIGWKKIGDFSENAVLDGYRAMIDEYYIGLNIYFDSLKTPMRYAGPKEAIFHAIIRRNLGCTHFIIGRDHAGVGDYYGKYEAQELARDILKTNKLGIELLLLSEPFYCHKCGQIVSDKTCKHSAEFIEKISGTKIRSMLANNKRPNELYMRTEVADAIIKLDTKKFIEG